MYRMLFYYKWSTISTCKHVCLYTHCSLSSWQLIQVLIWFQSSNLYPRLHFTVIRQNSKFAIIFRLLVNQSSCSIFSRTLYDRLCLFCGLLEEPSRGLDLCTFWNCAPKNSLPANYMHKTVFLQSDTVVLFFSLHVSVRLPFSSDIFFFGKLTGINGSWIGYVRAIQWRLLDAVSSKRSSCQPWKQVVRHKQP